MKYKKWDRRFSFATNPRLLIVHANKYFFGQLLLKTKTDQGKRFFFFSFKKRRRKKKGNQLISLFQKITHEPNGKPTSKRQMFDI
jgi:hypothetical protein